MPHRDAMVNDPIDRPGPDRKERTMDIRTDTATARVAPGPARPSTSPSV